MSYIIWQNRAFRFYLAARLLQTRELLSPSAYCATQSLELLLKATLVYWDRTFDPEAVGHAIAKLVRMVRNRARNAKEIAVPEYFYFEQRFHTTTRYPTGSKGVLVPGSMIADLDQLFVALISLVPFQFNSELARALAGRPMASLAILRQSNGAMRQLRK